MSRFLITLSPKTTTTMTTTTEITNGTTTGQENTTMYPKSELYIIDLFIKCAIVAAVTMIGLVIGYIIARKRLKKRHRWESKTSATYQYVYNEKCEVMVNPPSVQKSVMTPRITRKEEQAVYESPREPFWRKHLEEIEKLPPAPPVFDPKLAMLQIEGEDAYVTILPEDSDILREEKGQEIVSERYSELHEEGAYLCPKTIKSTKLQRIKQSEHFYRKDTQEKAQNNEKDTYEDKNQSGLNDEAKESSPFKSEVPQVRTSQMDPGKKVFRSSLKIQLSTPSNPIRISQSS